VKRSFKRLSNWNGES